MKVRQKLKAFGPGRPSNFLTHLHTPSVDSGLRDGVQSTLRLTNQISLSVCCRHIPVQSSRVNAARLPGWQDKS